MAEGFVKIVRSNGLFSRPSAKVAIGGEESFCLRFYTRLAATGLGPTLPFSPDLPLKSDTRDLGLNKTSKEFSCQHLDEFAHQLLRKNDVDLCYN